MKNIDSLLEKYWAGETDRDEELALRAYFRSDNVSSDHAELVPLFSFFDAESSREYEGQPDLAFTRKSSGSSGVLRLLPRIGAIAATVALLLVVSLNLFTDDPTYKNKYTELQDPEEALAITMEALEFLSSNYEKGAEPATRHFKKFEKTAVFTTN